MTPIGKPPVDGEAGPETGAGASDPAWTASSSSESPVALPPAAACDEADAPLGRERWLMRQVELDREVMLVMAHALAADAHPQSRAMRFWRWLIDDYRTERRAANGTSGAREGLARDVLSAWNRRRRGIAGIRPSLGARSTR